jgi:hypothetical protein
MSDSFDPDMAPSSGPGQPTPAEGARNWTRRKRDPLPRGIFVHAASASKAVIYGIRYTCGLGHIHQEKAGPLKSDATRRYHERRGRMRDEPRWCPRVERREARKDAQAEAERRRGQIPFRRYADDGAPRRRRQEAVM